MEKLMNKMDDMELDMVVGGARVYLVTKVKNRIGGYDYHVAQGNYDGNMNDLDKLAEAGKIDELRKIAKMRDNGELRPGMGLEFIKNMREEGKHVIIIEKNRNDKVVGGTNTTLKIDGPFYQIIITGLFSDQRMALLICPKKKDQSKDRSFPREAARLHGNSVSKYSNTLVILPQESYLGKCYFFVFTQRKFGMGLCLLSSEQH